MTESTQANLRRSLGRLSIERPLYSWLIILFCIFGGIGGYLTLGKLEDPGITLKSALVITPWPGATASEVASQVSEVLESEIQTLDEIDFITSRNTPGLSVIEVHIRDTFDGRHLPQIWDKLRARVSDAAPNLPAGALSPRVNDTFGDIYGLYYAVTAPGFADEEIHEIARFLRRELLSVRGVGDVQLLGLPEEAVYVEPDPATLANLGVPPGAILGALGRVTGVTPAGTLRDGAARVQVEAPEQEAATLTLQGLTLGAEGRTFNLVDLAGIHRGRVEDPSHLIRHNGQEAFTLGVSALDTENIVAVGARVEAALEATLALLPLGVDVQPIYEQHRVVDKANGDFLLSLALSVSVVIGVLALFMGWRAAVVVGTTLALTVTATFFFMMLFGIKVERISLGAMIIAMGMLVDNAIVMAEGMQVAMRRGLRAVDAAEETARRTQLPLLGATVIGAMAFAGIGLSPDSAGEFLFSLFAVITISLLLSWLLAVTVTPFLGSRLFRTAEAPAPGGAVSDPGDAVCDPYDRPFFRGYAGIVRGALRARGIVIAGLLATTLVGFGAMGFVTQQFFPPALTPLFYLNYHGQQGNAIEQTSRDLAVVERWLAERPDVVAVTATMGQGVSRFMLTYTPAKPDPAYGQLVIRASSHEAIPDLRDDLTDFAREALPWAETRVEQIMYGPPVGADVEVRLSGPDPDPLRDLADQALGILQGTPLLQSQRIDWRERTFVTRPLYAQDRAQALGVSRADVATTLALATDGLPAGTIREGDRDIPILVRTPRAFFSPEGMLVDQLVFAQGVGGYVPLEQVFDGFEVRARDTAILRRDRLPTMAVQGFTVPGVLADQAFREVRPALEALDLPPGYRLEWGGEYESSRDAQQSLGRQMPLAFGIMLLITVLLFGKLRQTAVIWTVVPMAVTGAAVGLLVTGLPFSFTALLGLLSLSGMLIKNAIVLVEEIDAYKVENGLWQSEAIVQASITRVRPVMLAAGTTILGMAPLVFDPFFASMAVTIMAGLGFASVLTLVGVPVLYHTYLRAERRAEESGPRSNVRRGGGPSASWAPAVFVLASVVTLMGQAEEVQAEVRQAEAAQAGQVASSDPLEAAVADALRHSQVLAIQRGAAGEALAAARGARSTLFPTLTLESRVTELRGGLDLGEALNPAYDALNDLLGELRFPTDLEATVPFRHETRLRIVQPLFNPQAAAGRDAARFAAEGEIAWTAGVARQVAAEAQRALVVASAAVEERRILDTALDRAREAERVAEALLTEGVVTPAAVSQARADRSELEGRIEAARSREDAARWALQRITGRPLDAAVPELGERLTSPMGGLDAGGLGGTASEPGNADVGSFPFDPGSAPQAREELARLDAQLRAAEAALGGAAAGRLPTLALVADPGFQGPRVRLDGDSRTASVSLVASWTVFGGGRIRAGVAEAEARRTQLLEARSLAAEGLELEARVAHRALVAAEAALPAAEARLVAAGETYALTLERFQEGIASPFELTDARAGLSAAELGQALALHRRLLAWVDFEHAAGLRPMGPLSANSGVGREVRVP